MTSISQFIIIFDLFLLHQLLF